jgi:hypothetical protein
MQLTLEHKSVAEATDRYVRSLVNIVQGKSDVLGFAYAINGNLNSADVYGSTELFRRMWPKMLHSTAAEAVAERGKPKSPAAVDAAGVKSALAAAEQAQEAARERNGRVSVSRKESEKLLLFESRDREAKGEWVHRSYVVK